MQGILKYNSSSESKFGSAIISYYYSNEAPFFSTKFYSINKYNLSYHPMSDHSSLYIQDEYTFSLDLQ
jgi:hypothetical protein